MTAAIAIASAHPIPQTATARAVLVKSSACRTATIIAASIQTAAIANTGIVAFDITPSTRSRPGADANPIVRRS